MIALAARCWGLSLAPTIEKLRSAGVPITSSRKVISTYIKEHVDYREKVDELWDLAKHHYPVAGKEVQRLRSALKISSGLDSDQWDAGPAHLVGALTKSHLRKFFEETSNKMQYYRVFKDSKSRKWGDVLVFPLRDVPGRIASFLFVGRQAKPDDWVLKILSNRPLPAAPVAGKNFYSVEAGISMHPGLYDALSSWDNQVIAIPGVVEGLVIQMKHWENSTLPLPIVAYPCDDDTEVKTTWNIFAKNRLIFWMPDFNRTVLKNAIRTGAEISWCGPIEDGPEALQTFIRRSLPEQLVKTIIKRARPWQRALARQLSKISDVEAEELLLQLQLDGVNLDDLLLKCPRKVKARLQGLLGRKAFGQVVWGGDRHIVEKDGGLYTSSRQPETQELIMDAQLRLDNFIVQDRTEKMFYQGRIFYEGTKIPFCVEKSEFEQNPMKWIQDRLIQERLGYLRYSKKWSDRLIEIAVQFNKPKFIRAAGKVGWDGQDQTFVFPRYRILANGQIKRINEHLFADTAPAANLPFPMALSGQEFHPLFPPGHLCGMLWSVLLTLCANVVAPVYNRPTCGVSILGSGMERVARQVAEAAGCMYREVKPKAPASKDSLVEVEQEHNWPLSIYIDRMRGPKTIVNWLDPPSHWRFRHNCFVNLDWYWSALKKMTGGWHVLETELPGELSSETMLAISQFIPAYLRDLCSRRLMLHSDDQKSYLEQILDDLVYFAQQHHVPAEQILPAMGYVWEENGSRAADAFAELTGEFLKTGNVITCPAGFEDGKAVCYIQDEIDGLPVMKISKEDFQSLLQKKKVVASDPLPISECLSRAGVLVADAPDYWAVKREWWLSRVRKASAEKSGLFRVWA